MRHRPMRLSVTILLALAFVALLVPVAPVAAAPVRALDSPRALRLRPLTGGADISSAVTLGPGETVTGSLDPATRPDDVYRIFLLPGEILNVALTGPAGSDFPVYLYRPGSTSLADSDFFDISLGPTGDTGYPQTIEFVCGTAGFHYLDIYAYEGSGAYTMNVSVAPEPAAMDRLAGGDRYATALDVSATGWTAGATSNVVVATGANFADALAASALAGSYDCPVLLTPRTYPATGLLDEIDRLRGSGSMRVFIVGSGSAVDTVVANAIDARTDVSVTRLAGRNRYETAVEIGEEVRQHEADLGRPWKGEAFVCLGTNFPDALAISPYAARNRMPVLLVQKDLAPQVTQDAFAPLGITKAWVIGGTGTITDTTKNSLNVATKERLQGDNRYHTATVVAEHAITSGWAFNDRVGFATGSNFPDALGGGAYVGRAGGVLLLSQPDWISDPAYDFVANHASTLGAMDVFGSHTTLSDWIFTDFLDAIDTGLSGP